MKKRTLWKWHYLGKQARKQIVRAHAVAKKQKNEQMVVQTKQYAKV